jgi:hypothetical protein
MHIHTLKTRLLILFIALFAHSTLAAAPVGFNVSGLYKLNSSMPFANIFKGSQGWFTSCEYNWVEKRAIDPGCTANNAFNTKEQGWIDLDENGWIRSLPLRHEPPIFTGATSSITLPPDFPTGSYVMTYVGEGSITVAGGVQITRQQNGRIEFQINNPAKGLKIQIKKTNPQNYIRNIDVFAAANERTYTGIPFRADYLSKVRPFDAIRFMPWQNAKETKIVRWQDRPKPESAHYNGTEGVPVEIMVDLANQSNSDPWFTVPYKANQDYIRNFAQLVKDRLDPRQKVYIEYSNEVWNALYPVYHLAVRQSQAMWPTAHQDKGGLRKQYLVANWYAKKSVETCNIWKQTFGSQRNRVVCVISSFARTPDIARETLACPLVSNTPCANTVDAYAVAPYFGDYLALKQNRSIVKQWASSPNGVDNVFAELMNGGLIPNGPAGGAIPLAYNNGIKGSAAVAKEFGVKLLAYEGGQHLKRDDPPHTLRDPEILGMFLKANQDPRMGQLYREYLNTWRRSGGDLFMHFYGVAQSEPNTAFGMLETSNSGSTPKYNALMDYSRAP